MAQHIPDNEVLASKAFTNQSSEFDRIDRENSMIAWIRERVYAEVMRRVPANCEMLELNCGTGIDATFFAQNGIRVLATDNSDGMLQELRQKIETLQLQEKLNAEKCSFNNLENLYGRQFDYVFSNFGGLNCTDNLAKVLSDIDVLLKPGGHFTLVIMPRACPWELLMLFKGYFKTAFRRFKKNGTPAHVEGVYFKSYYYNPKYVIRRFKNYKPLSLRGLSIVMPPPFIEHFKEKHPKLFSWLEKIENRIWNKAPFNRWCDHYMITMQKPNSTTLSPVKQAR